MADLVPLQDLLTFTRDGEWGKGEAAHDLVKMAVIRGTDFSAVRHGDVSSVPVRYIPKEAADRKALRPGDILIETAGGTKDQQTGRTVYLNQRVFDALEIPVTCASFSRFLRVNSEIVDPSYLFWYLQSIYTTGEMFPYHIQHTGVARFQYTDFAAQWRVPVPDKDRQLAIAEILGSLDDKIELNRRMNETLEAMAQAIFRDWFVDFGPTRRKIDGTNDPVEIMGGLVSDPERARQMAGLFPARLGDDGLPDGWETASVGSVTLLLKRGIAPAYADQGMPVVNQRCIRNSTLDFGLARHHDAGKRNPKERLLQVGDVLINSTGVGTLGRVATVRRLPGPATADSHVTICRPDRSKISNAILSLFLEASEPEIAGMGHGSTGQTELSATSLGGLVISVAPRKVQHSFDSIVAPLRELSSSNADQNRTLAATRDLLLPKLMSGEIRLRDVEAELEAAQ